MYSGRNVASNMRKAQSRGGVVGCSAGKNSTEEKITNNDSAPTKTTYTVLYYKRKNKVHKSKGVSKLDGTLTVVPGSSSSLSVTLQSTDTEAIVYRGGLRSNGNNTATFEIDETVCIGPYEVEILSCDNNTNDDSNANQTKSNLNHPLISTNNMSKVMKNRKLLDTTNATRPSLGKKRLGLGGSNLNRRAGLGGSVRSLSGTTRKPDTVRAALTVRKRARTPSESSDDGNTSTSPLTGVAMSKTAPILPGFKRPILSRTKTKTRNIISRASSSITANRKRRANLLSSSATGSVAATNSMDIINGSNTQNFFPGAIGTLLVPHSIRKSLRPHQIEGVVFLWNCLTGNGKVASVSEHITEDDEVSPKGCILSDEMGLGKTLMTIATISALHRQNRESRFVVVCPSSLVGNWAREFDKWLGKVGLPKRVVVKKGGEEGLSQIKAFGASTKRTSEVLIVSYDLFRRKASVLQNVQRVGLLVVDEGHRLKNTSGSLTMTALESLPCEARLCITATPIQNNLGDLYTIVNFVCPGVLGDIATFRREYERPIAAISSKRSGACTADQMIRGQESRRALDRILQSIMLRRLQKDVLKTLLPPRHEFLLFCRPTQKQRKLYSKISKCHGPNGRDEGSSSQEALSALVGLRKICTHPDLLEGPTNENSHGAVARSTMDCEGSGKLLVLQDLIMQMREKEPTDKVVIISNFTSTLTVVEDAILKQLNLNFLRLDGSISSADRQSLVDTFNRTSANMNFALTLSSKAGGVGLNLIGANRLIMLDPDWNPATDCQAMARIYREGQSKTCFIYRCFTSGTLEEVILQRQMQKGSLATMTMDRSQKTNDTADRLNANELRDCFTLKDERCVCDTRRKIGTWPDYDGEASLVSQGCQDKVLLSVAAMENAKGSELSFVHIVKDKGANGREHATGNESDALTNALDRDYDNESGKDKDYSCGMNVHRNGCESGSSDEEYEFE